MNLQVLLILAALFCHSQSMRTNDLPESEIEDEEEERTNSIFDKILTANKGNEKWLIFGDIIVNASRGAKICPFRTCYWPKGRDGLVRVPYELSNKFNSKQKELIHRSLVELNTLTCVRFVTHTTERDYVKVLSYNGCAAGVGRFGGEQKVFLENKGCMWRGVIQHEFNHVMGFYHEQSRKDRDLYVQIIWDNISKGQEHNFVERNLETFGLPYDYHSVMHYGKYAFSKTHGKPTIVPIPNPNQIIGQVDGFTTLDYAKLNTLYDCKMCVTVLSEWSGSLMTLNYPSKYMSNSNCFWLIRTQRKQIQLTFRAVEIESSSGCSKDYIKVYDGDSKTSRVLLNKSCGNVKLPLLIGSGNLMLIEFVSDRSITAPGFMASYSVGRCGGTLTTKTDCS
uniref:Metalloendopeptidase n=1 Tax=Latimeria chalumnae TaxID=7897 RepID=M3XHI8_LATCH|nr:PREDICTED: astacin-like metalloendopeptidase isoform X2 [Latimeria chalumnae]|eukprot:XP_014344695.1 PREDICTED: astacin-like metalloendopeptidase isoform X2 [Latimeria chalumnae]